MIDRYQTLAKNYYDVLLIAAYRPEWVRCLRSSGLSVLIAEDLESAEKLIREASLGVVLIDLEVDGSDSINFSAWRQQGHSSTQIILVTHSDEDTLRAIQGITRGADGHLPLLLSAEALQLQMAHSLNRYRELESEHSKSAEIESLVIDQTFELQQMHVEIMKLLSVASCYRDHETGAHNQRVGTVSGLLASAVGWEDQQTADLRLAALMHDIGKLAIPDMILRKPGKLTDEEYSLMQKHTILGDEILAASKLPVLTLSRQIALNHHERWDGAGYPYRVAASEIPSAARIVAIADVYDALTHDRVYRPALPEAEALTIMSQGRGSHFDPDLLDVFFDIRDEVNQVNATILEDNTEQSQKRAIWSELAT